MTTLRIAIVHEWLAVARGAERALDALCEAFPAADLFTLFDHGGPMPARIRRGRRITRSFLQKIPFSSHRHLLPLMPLAVESLDLRGYDIVISAHHCVSKGVIAPSEALHVAYVYSPPRYAWDDFELFFARTRVPLPVRLIGRGVAHYLRLWDESTAKRPDHYLACSRYIAACVERRYRRSADVVPPPVETGRFHPTGSPPDDQYLYVGALVPQKRVELAIQACNILRRHLEIVGIGPEESRLRALAGPTIRFRGRLSDAEVASLMARSRALLHLGREDFGIVMVESLAAGRPVVAFAAGGAPEILGAGAGVFVAEQTVPAVAAAILELERRYQEFDPRVLRVRAEAFDRATFVTRMRTVIHELWAEHRARREAAVGAKSSICAGAPIVPLEGGRRTLSKL